MPTVEIVANVRRCPFCNGSNVVFVVDTPERTAYAGCRDCNATGPRVPLLCPPGIVCPAASRQVVDCWNTRGEMVAACYLLESRESAPTKGAP